MIWREDALTECLHSAPLQDIPLVVSICISYYLNYSLVVPHLEPRTRYVNMIAGGAIMLCTCTNVTENGKKTRRSIRLP